MACALWEKRRLKPAFQLFLAAAQDGDRASQLNVGYCFDCGVGVKKNRDKALFWYRRAHRRGDSSATNNIGTIYRDLGLKGRALQWFQRALERGNHGSALDIGKVYLDQKDLARATQYLELASRSSDVSEATTEEAARLLRTVQIQTARNVRDHLFNAVDGLNESVRSLQGTIPDVEFQEYRRRCGALMAEIWELLEPIFREHPNLRPEELKDSDS
jgi:tetratricopeptide (TPR) repeat protein